MKGETREKIKRRWKGRGRRKKNITNSKFNEVYRELEDSKSPRSQYLLVLTRRCLISRRKRSKNVRICARYYRAHLVTWTSVNRSCISLVTQHVTRHITYIAVKRTREKLCTYPWYSTRIFERAKSGRKGGTGVVYAIDIAYRFPGRGKEGRVDPSSEQILFKYFLVRPKNIFVTRLWNIELVLVNAVN